MPTPIIKLDDIIIQFKQKKQQITAVDNVSLTVNRGDIYGIIGYSGAGKSTLVRVINQLQVPTSGTVTVNDQVLFQHDRTHSRPQTQLKGTTLRRARRKIGMIFQHFNLLNERTVRENIAFALRHTSLSTAEKAAKITDLLTLVELSDRADNYPNQLSGGQKQRVAIARALANDPEILISDEATSALDPKTTQQILTLLQRLNRELGLTIILITHEMQAVKAIANHVAVMQAGKIIERGPLLTIFAQPKEALTREFITTTQPITAARDKICALPIITNLPANNRFVQIDYVGNETDQPLIVSLFRDYQVTANILYGSMDVLDGTTVGSLLVTLSGSPDKLAAACAHLQQTVTLTDLTKGGHA